MFIAKLNEEPEIFSSIQGEGKYIRRPSVFVRCSTCNLNCFWCDTDYTWNWKGTSYVHKDDAINGPRKFIAAEEIITMTSAEVAEVVQRFSCRNVVFTGGEPMLQQKELSEVMRFLRTTSLDYQFEVESNGTIMPSSEFDAAIYLYTVSHKPSFLIDLLRNYFRREIFRFQIWRRKNFEAYTPYMLKNFYKAISEIWKLQQKNNYAVGLLRES